MLVMLRPVMVVRSRNAASKKTMNEPTWLDYIKAFGSIATPFFVPILTGIGWNIRTRLERRQELEDQLREDRITIYNELLEPFIILFMTDAAWQSDPKNKYTRKDGIAQN
jgi:hypothetical protein